MADRADMADRANSRVILPPMAYIDGKSEIISHSLAHWPTDSPNFKEMLSHLKKDNHQEDTNGDTFPGISEKT